VFIKCIGLVKDNGGMLSEENELAYSRIQDKMLFVHYPLVYLMKKKTECKMTKDLRLCSEQKMKYRIL
jgi:hypothetical protein